MRYRRDFSRWLFARAGASLLAALAPAVFGAQPRLLKQLWLGEEAGPTVVETAIPRTPANLPTRVFLLHFPGISAASIAVGTSLWTRVLLPGIGTSQDPGQPELPVWRKLLSLDPQARLVYKSVVTAREEFDLAGNGLPRRLFPVRRPIPKIPGVTSANPETAQNLMAGRESATETVRIRDLGIERGRRLELLEVFPLTGDPRKGTLTLRQSIEIKLAATNSGGSGALAMNATPTGSSVPHLLIITPDKFIATLNGFIAFKTNQGWNVNVAPLSVVGTNAPSIQNYVKTQYAAERTRPTHLLLVGDTDTIPAWRGQGAYQPDTDLYYACMDGTNDWLPDLAYGRFPARTATELSNMVMRTLYYETNVTSFAPFLSHAAFITSDENYTLTEGTQDSIIAQYFDPRACVSRRLYRHTYLATTANIANAINAGCAMISFSGHGAPQEWLDPVLRVSDVEGLANHFQWPFVSSFACDTGAYGAYDECFAEAWLRKPWSGGAIAVLAASQATYWEEDDVFEKCVFAAMFDEDAELGDAINSAKRRYLEFYGPNSETLQYFEQYTLFGDPTVKLHLAERLRMLGIRAGQDGTVVQWVGGTASTQYLERVNAFGPGAAWVCVLTNTPPTPPTNTFVDKFTENGAAFYRIRASQ